jgi:hypothetical protein
MRLRENMLIELPARDERESMAEHRRRSGPTQARPPVEAGDDPSGETTTPVVMAVRRQVARVLWIAPDHHACVVIDVCAHPKKGAGTPWYVLSP